MAEKTSIEWADATWNPVTGCTKISSGCKNCYAERLAERFRGVEGHYYENGFDVRLRPEKLEEPLRWKKSKRIFVCSMSDLFHKHIPEDFRARIFETMEKAEHHKFLLLTKRPKSMYLFLKERYCRGRLDWPIPSHFWCGTSIENQRTAPRARELCWLPRYLVKFLSLEPLLEDVADEIWMDDIRWVIVGGESGPGARPMHPDWVRAIRDRCLTGERKNRKSFFFKQWGGAQKKKTGRLLDGREWNEIPLT